MADGDRERLVEDIARSRARVDELERARNDELTRIAELDARVAALDAIAQLPVNIEPESALPSEATGQHEVRRSPQVKLQIFRRIQRSWDPTVMKTHRKRGCGYISVGSS